MTTLAIDTGAACLWGFLDSSDWQRSLNGLGAFDALDKLIGTAQSATSPQLSWAWGYNADGSPKYQRFYAPRLDADRTRGRVSVMTWMSMNGGDRTNPTQIQAFNNESILAGKHDGYLQQFAQDAAAYGHKFVIRFNPEMNGWWEGPFSEYDSSGKLANGNTDGSFVRMWRYVIDKVRPIAPNILWYWCANPLGGNSASPTYIGRLPHFYPGDSYVDQVGYDVYNKAADGGSPWLTFRECLEGRPSGWPANSVAPMLALAPGKPWIIGELGCAAGTTGDTTPGAGDRAAWIADMLEQIRTRYPFIRLIQYYNIGPYMIDAAAAVGFTQGTTASPNFPGAPLPDPESVLYRVVSTTTGATTNDAQVATLTAQLATLQQRLSADDSQLQGSLGQIAALNTQLAQANNRLAQYQQASAQLIGGTDALRGLQQASP